MVGSIMEEAFKNLCIETKQTCPPNDKLPENPFKVIFKLKQHTPMIHFQGDQHRATLRATEFKPKLDKFLSKQGAVPEGDKYYQDYKVKISCNEVSKGEPVEKGYPLYFGNMGDGSSDKIKFVYSKEPIVIEIFSKNQELLKTIGENICNFLSQTNFGTRQSKGFGSFYLDDSHKSDKLYKEPKADFIFELEIKKNNDAPFKDLADFKDLFKGIEFFYKTLRSGINNCRYDKEKKTTTTLFYFKSFLFLYAKEKNIQWDKKTIKEQFFNYRLREQINKHDENNEILTYSYKNKYLMRDLLGLSSSQEWGSNYNKCKIEKNDPKGEVERFASPLLFKPILPILEEGNNASSYNVKIYIIIKSINEKMLDRKFKIKCSNPVNEFSLPTPKSFDFDLKEYIKFCMEKGKVLSEHVDKKFQNRNEYVQLVNIYKSLKEINNA